MSKMARPAATMFNKWLQGIRVAVPNNNERCTLYEYIMEYQMHTIYNTAIDTEKSNLSPAAALALAMLQGDIDEVCEMRVDSNNARRDNGSKSISNRDTNTSQPLPAPASTQDNTIQSNIIQNNIDNSNTMQPLDAGALTLGSISCFDLGLALIRKGYMLRDTETLRNIYDRAKSAHDPVAYAARAFAESRLDNPEQGALIANFLAATKCTHTDALGIFGISKEDSTLIIRCTAAAGAVLEKKSGNLQEFLQPYGADNVEYMYNGK